MIAISWPSFSSTCPEYEFTVLLLHQPAQYHDHETENVKETAPLYHHSMISRWHVIMKPR
jgi:hypothetical protein